MFDEDKTAASADPNDLGTMDDALSKPPTTTTKVLKLFEAARRVARNLDDHVEKIEIGRLERLPKLLAAIYQFREAGREDPDSYEMLLARQGIDTEQSATTDYHPAVKAIVQSDQCHRHKGLITEYAQACEGMRREKVSPAKAAQWLCTPQVVRGKCVIGLQKARLIYNSFDDVKERKREGRLKRQQSRIETVKQAVAECSKPLATLEALPGFSPEDICLVLASTDQNGRVLLTERLTSDQLIIEQVLRRVRK